MSTGDNAASNRGPPVNEWTPNDETLHVGYRTFIATVFLVAFALAEPPPSNSYLPPPPIAQGAGYPRGPQGQNFAGAPEVVAARSVESSNGGSEVHGGIEDQSGIGPHSGIGAHGGVGLRGGIGAVGGFGAHGSLRVHGGQDANDVHSNGLARSGYHNHEAGPQARFGAEEHGYEYSAAASGRNALDQADSEPANYNFGYMVNDYQEGTEFGHREERQHEHAQGEYHVVLPDGRKQTVSYEADERGFKPQISYQETEDLSRSGYDSNANNVKSSDHHGYDGISSHGNGYDGISNHGNGYDGNSDHGNGDARSGGY